MTHPSFITLPYTLERDPPPFEGNDIKYPEALVRHFLTAFTNKDDKVFDPFAGLGTTLFVAEEMGRKAYGIEADPLKQQWVAGQLDQWANLIYEDSFHVAKLGLPKMDFCMTSPPFMPNHHSWNPLFGGDPAKSGYPAYLRRMASIFANMQSIMKKGSKVVVQVDNIPGRSYTPLVRDLSLAISKSFKPEGETIVAWQDAPERYSHTHCLIFKKA